MLDLSWAVPNSGYEWLRTKGYPGWKLDAGVEDWYLIECVDVGQQVEGVFYPVFKKTGLFRNFASILATREDVLLFANTYGRLTSNHSGVPIDRPVKNEPGSSHLVSGEALGFWYEEIFAMRHAVEIWEKAKAGDSEGLSAFIRWTDGEVNYVAPSRSSLKDMQIASRTYRPERLALLRDGDTVEPSMYVLQNIVNRKLRHRPVTPMLMWDRTRRAATLLVRLNPTDLLSAMWAQFAYAIEGDRNYRSCDQCQKWFEVAAEKREDARFCSNACRFKAYRTRQKKAQRLHSEGSSLKAIADQLGSDVKTIKGWVSK